MTETTRNPPMTDAQKKQAERDRRKADGQVALSGWLSASDHAALTQMARDAGMTQAQAVSGLIGMRAQHQDELDALKAEPGNVVTLRKGRRFRTINEIRGGRAKLHWFVGSRLYKKWVDLDAIRFVSP